MTGLMQPRNPEDTSTGCAEAFVEARSRANWRHVTATSLLVLIPCFWQSRIQAGDLSSHLYNAWLAELIGRGQLPGLTVARQSNNVLFDLALAGLMRVFGAGPAQRIAVSAAVLVFFWGAFAFVRSYARNPRTPWHVAPWLAMLAYGWVYHMGLFNFYVSLGICFGVLALLSRGGRRRIAAAVPLLATAYVAHVLPVLWAAGVLAYVLLGRALAPRYRLILVGAATGGLGVLGGVLYFRYGARWSSAQIMTISGADQAYVFSVHYMFFTVALLAIWLASFLRWFDAHGLLRTILDLRFQICFLCAASAIAIPGSIPIPGMRCTLTFLAERMSLVTAVLCCGMAARGIPRRVDVIGIAGVAALFFGCLYIDERALNRLESEMATAAANIPPGQRVISVLAEPSSRVNALAHLIDRVCAGRCFSYGNYEPSTAAFRVRADRPNPFVLWEYDLSWGIQAGGYIVQSRDIPLYNIDRCGPGREGLCAVPLRAGTRLRNTWLRTFPTLGRWDQRRDWE